jgi:hypothetical protein
VLEALVLFLFAIKEATAVGRPIDLRPALDRKQLERITKSPKENVQKAAKELMKLLY